MKHTSIITGMLVALLLLFGVGTAVADVPPDPPVPMIIEIEQVKVGLVDDAKEFESWAVVEVRSCPDGGPDFHIDLTKEGQPNVEAVVITPETAERYGTTGNPRITLGGQAYDILGYIYEVSGVKYLIVWCKVHGWEQLRP